MTKKERVVIFDGFCTLCNKTIKILIKIDKEKILMYTSLQGEYIKKLNIPQNIDSIIFYEEGVLYYKSTAVLKILRSLGGMWVLVNIFYVIPLFIRDFIYAIIAKYRYDIFGKMESCRMPTEDELALFLD